MTLEQTRLMEQILRAANNEPWGVWVGDPPEEPWDPYRFISPLRPTQPTQPNYTQAPTFKMPELIDDNYEKVREQLEGLLKLMMLLYQDFTDLRIAFDKMRRSKEEG